jgi:hypothetical protein
MFCDIGKHRESIARPYLVINSNGKSGRSHIQYFDLALAEWCMDCIAHSLSMDRLEARCQEDQTLD